MITRFKQYKEALNLNPVILARPELSSTGNLKIEEREIFALDLPSSNNLFERVEKNLHITMNNGGKFVLKNYFIAHEVGCILASGPEYEENLERCEHDEYQYNWEHLEKHSNPASDHAKHTARA